MTSALKAFSEKFPTEQPCCLWTAIQNSNIHTDPTEKQAVARGIVKDTLSEYARDYLNAYYDQASQLHPSRPFAAYSLGLFNQIPKFAARRSGKRSKTVLGWVHTFLIEAGEPELLQGFERAISHSLPK